MRTILAILLLAGPALRAQQAPDDHALIQQLLQRVKDLEEEVRRLRGGAPGGPRLPRRCPAGPASEPSSRHRGRPRRRAT